MGGGLSSSAAFELALLHALLLMNDISLSPAERIMLAHDAESKYVGLSCGYLDQGTIELADKCALVIHHRPYGNEKFAGVPLPMDLEGKYVLIGGFAPKKDHKLAQSGYNERRAACESALPVLRDILGEHVHYLGDVSFGEFLWNEKKIRERLGKHSRTADYLSYIVGENHRVLLFQIAAKQRDWEAIPRLFSDTLECSLERFDIGDPDGGLKFLSSFVQREFPRAGVQNIGGGWSPTTAAFVPSEQAEEYRQKVSSEFAKRFHVEYRTFKAEGGVPSAGIIT